MCCFSLFSLCSCCFGVFFPFCSQEGLFYAAENGCCQLLSPSIIISLSLLPASITETIHVPFLLLQALGLIPFACSLRYLTHASFFALAHAGSSSSCCGCVVMQISKIKTAVNNILQTRPSSSLVLEPKMYVFLCVDRGRSPERRCTQVSSYCASSSLPIKRLTYCACTIVCDNFKAVTHSALTSWRYQRELKTL